MQSSHSLKRRLILAAAILCLAAAFEVGRRFLKGTQNPGMGVWSAQVIFGFYFAILAVAVQRLQALSGSRRAFSGQQRLFLLALISLCSDLVLVNYQEAVKPPDASYGLVVLWDVATFFVWLRAIDLSGRRTEHKLIGSWTVAVAPILKLGREILFIPYTMFFVPTRCNPDADPISPYLDLVFGDLLVCLWICIPSSVLDGFRRGRLFPLAVFTGCVYWVLRAIDDIVSLILCHGFLPAQVPSFVLPFVYIIIAVGVTALVWRSNALGIGTFFGINRSSRFELSHQPKG